MTQKPIRLSDLFRYYQALPHQNAALIELEQLILKSNPTAFDRDQPWYATWKSAVDPKGENSWDGIKAAAKQAGAKYPECVAAQWALESGWGRHTSGKNNFFGLKGDGTETSTSEYIDGTWIEITDSFIDFPSITACVEYLVQRWYKNYKSYWGVNNAPNREDCARALVREGYATDPEYAEKLIRLMDENETTGSSEKVLDVPYEYQLDNASGTGYRECFSSSCAMIAKFYGEVSSDDAYNIIRNDFGDTTSVGAQLDALGECGLKPRFITNGTAEILEKEIDAGRPVAVGWLHNGPIGDPKGGGHWSCCVGYTPEAFIFHDPNGKANMLKGGYESNTQESGKFVHYSRSNWLRRWECDGPGTGWAILVDPK